MLENCKFRFDFCGVILEYILEPIGVVIRDLGAIIDFSFEQLRKVNIVVLQAFYNLVQRRLCMYHGWCIKFLWISTLLKLTLFLFMKSFESSTTKEINSINQ